MGSEMCIRDRCDDGVRELVIGDFGPRWRLLGFMAQNSSTGRVGPREHGRAKTKERQAERGRKSARGCRAMWHVVAVPRGTVVPRVVLSRLLFGG